MSFFYLASASPRRQDILNSLGLDFKVIPNLLHDENLDISKGSIRNQLKYLCLEKAKASSKAIKGWILTADTIIYHKDKPIGKPTSKHDAFSILNKLSNSSHHVITACCLFNSITKKHFFCSDIATVHFNVLSKQDIETYINDFKPFDKAGSYGIQDIPTHFLKKLDGNTNTVMGLPRHKLKKFLKCIYT